MQTHNYNLLEISNNHTFVGTYSAKLPDQVIITQQSQGIHVYSIFDQKCQRSWIVPPSISFGCETVLDKQGNYYAVVKQNKNNNNIWCWDQNVEDLIKNTNAVSKVKFDETIFQLVPSKVHPFIVVVQEYGSFQIVRNNLKVIGSHSAEKKDTLGTVCWAHTTKNQEKSNVLLLVLELETVYTFQCFLLQYEASGPSCSVQHIASHTFKKPNRSSMLACSYESQSQVFSVLWSDFSWDVYKIGDILEGQKASWPLPKITQNMDHLFSVEKKATGKPKGKKIDLRNTNIITATSLPNGLTMIAGPSKENPQTYSLMVWEHNYGTLVHTTYVNATTKNDLPQFIKLSLSKEKNMVTVCLPQKVEVLSISTHAPNLANLVGKLNMKSEAPKMVHKSVLPTPFDLILAVDTAYGGVEGPSFDWKQKADITLSAPQQQKLINDVLDTTKTASATDVEKLWNEALRFAGGAVNKLPLLFINSIAYRNLTDGSLPLDNDSYLAQLMQHKLLSGQSSYYQLVPFLIKRNAVNLLVMCMEFVEDLSAYDIIHMTKYITTKGGPYVRKHFKQPDTPQGTADAEQMFLNVVVNHVASHTFMQEAISRLSFAQVMKLLLCVHNWLARFAAEIDSSIDTTALGIGTMEDHHNIVPSFASVVSWASLLLDTNYVQFMVSAQQAQPFIDNMFKCVDVLVSGYRECADASSYVISLATLSHRRVHAKEYEISVLQLKELSLPKEQK